MSITNNTTDTGRTRLDVQIARLKDRVWFTRKARIQMEKRILAADGHAKRLLALYLVGSLLLPLLLFNIDVLKTSDVSDFFLTLACVFGSLLFCQFCRVSASRAEAVRKNYVDLGRLHDALMEIDFEPDEEKRKRTFSQALDRYTELLRDSENHSSLDDKIARCGAVGLITRLPTRKERLIVSGWRCLKYLVLGAAYGGPVAVGLYLVQCNVRG